MSDVAGGAVAFLILLALLALRVPIGVAMLAVGCGGFAWIQGWGPLFSFLKTAPFDTFATYSFSVIPLFLLMGNVASTSGLSARLFRGANALLGHYRGGMAMAAVGACAAFGTICGSSLATAATMGQVALPEMRKYGYSGALATGTLAAGGTLGILVPPSIPLVVYAILTEQNIAKLFLAAFIPAGIAVIGFFLAIRAYLLFDPEAAPAPFKLPTVTRLQQVVATWPVLAIFLIVFIGMNGDFFVGRSLFTPTEGAAIGAMLATIAAVTVGGLTWRNVMQSLAATAGQSGMIFLILLGAELYNAFLARTHMPQLAALWVAGLGISPTWYGGDRGDLHPAGLPHGQPQHDPAHRADLLPDDHGPAVRLDAGAHRDLVRHPHPDRGRARLDPSAGRAQCLRHPEHRRRRLAAGDIQGGRAFLDRGIPPRVAHHRLPGHHLGVDPLSQSAAIDAAALYWR